MTLGSDQRPIRKSHREHEPTAGETSEWFTPPEIFRALRNADGTPLIFDLDPCHPGEGTPHCCVPARRVLTRRENGLLVPWPKGDLVWINSAQSDGRRAVVDWLKPFFIHGNGIFLLPARLSADYWHEVIFPNAELLLLTDGKIKFVRPDGSIGKQPGYNNALIGMGEIACNALRRSGLGHCVVVDRSAAPSLRHQRRRA
jgi:hypothetical protein